MSRDYAERMRRLVSDLYGDPPPPTGFSRGGPGPSSYQCDGCGGGAVIVNGPLPGDDPSRARRPLTFTCGQCNRTVAAVRAFGS